MRVIQDSDDDTGSEIEDNGATNAPNAPNKRVKVASSGGTGSTESLKRAFAKAHHDHLQSPSAQDATFSANEPQSSISLPEHPTKRIKTSNDPDGDIVSSTVQLANSVTQGILGTARVNYPPTDPVQYRTNPMISHGTQIVNFMDIPDTMRQEYVHHEPKALFPEPSSTIPNATQTQRRLLEGIGGPGLLGSESDSGVPQSQHPPQPSVPWSDILNFSPAGAEEQSDHCNQRSEPASDAVHHQPVSGRTQDISISQPARCDSSVRSRDSPLKHEMVSEHIKLKVPNPSQYPAHSNQNPRVKAAQSEQNAQQSLSRVPSQEHLNNAGSTQESDDELMAMGLAAEQYKPRPSRSRSLKVSTDEPVDYSIRPEKAGKGPRQRKTTSSATTTRSASANNLIGTPQKVKQICDMGFTPTSTGKALKQNHGDVTQTIEWLINNGMGEDELARPNTPKRTTPSKVIAVDVSNAATESPIMKLQAVEDTTTTSKSLPVANIVPSPEPNLPEPREVVRDQLDRPMAPQGDQSKSPKVQVVIPSRSPRTKAMQEYTHPQKSVASKQPKRRKTTSDLPEPKVDCETSLAVEPPTEQKKRGRPKKVANASLPTGATQEEGSEMKRPPKVSTKENDALVHQTIEASSKHATAVVEPGDHKVEDAPTNPSHSLKESSVQRPSTTSHMPEQATKTPSRSPTGKGKVTYRVGLSRRARIAPLLRTLKK
ncbi:hypothetical protein DE146DRAFT_750329 [Phaeosphaeria sp. MPI-PUGE-AT-0046c]|nr:hypothetical protein DE146DRAFT_750329 [Phaeosphaeria sp. MPI-PUGE-AT-0046c]